VKVQDHLAPRLVYTRRFSGVAANGPDSQVNFHALILEEIGSGHHIDEDPNEKKTNEIIYCDHQPKRNRLFGTEGPTKTRTNLPGKSRKPSHEQ
jgi:hypothetical protein